MPIPTDSSDFELVNRVFIEIEARKSANGNRTISRAEEIVRQVWAALGIIENGSFQYFFENDMDPEVVAQALDALGLSADAEIFRRAERLLSNAVPNRGWGERLRFLQRHEKTFDSLARAFVRERARIEARLANFIRSHGDQWRDLSR